MIDRQKIRTGAMAKINRIYLGSIAVLMYLESIAKDDIATCSLQTIARNTGYGRATVIRMLRALENENIVIRLHCARGINMDYAIIVTEEFYATD